ncbi:hypothetical protein TrLO_g1911 [Triparma laevis f. longispina]|uniref:Uncharacterized protein n=1 Tax=Triparma laevis f. longispina TaxID=1714387 RepID=A0A9W7AKX7_9STRA|nr:hypothetical protein TrLO_g1911 [Triparma laevis f. longispina]
MKAFTALALLLLTTQSTSWVISTSRRHSHLSGSFFEEELPISSPVSLVADLAPPPIHPANDASTPSYHVTYKVKRVKAAPKRLFNGSKPLTSSAASSRRFVIKGLVGAAVLSLTSAAPQPAQAMFGLGGSVDPDSPIVYCDEDVMAKKSHGTTENPVTSVRWNVDSNLADKICSFNRHFAEPAGSFEKNDLYLSEIQKLKPGETLTYYDTVTNLPLFTAPINRTVDQFLQESYTHGWPSFRDSEVNWENTRVLKSSGETVSKDGTHLGHNLPDGKGNRYCINLVSVAGVGKV